MLFKKYYTIKEAAAKLGVTTTTLIHWDNSGKIPKVRRHPKNGYRIFTDEDIVKIKLLRRDY